MGGCLKKKDSSHKRNSERTCRMSSTVLWQESRAGVEIHSSSHLQYKNLILLFREAVQYKVLGTHKKLVRRLKLTDREVKVT